MCVAMTTHIVARATPSLSCHVITSPVLRVPIGNAGTRKGIRMGNESSPEGDVPGWVILGPQSVPERWRSRAIQMMLVPMLPAEAAQLLSNAPVEDGIASAQVPFVRLLARGLSTAQIARELGISHRTVQRHVARLRDQFGVATIQQLATELARRGF